MANKSEEKKQKMTLLDYYENLPKSSYPKKDFIQRIMSECNVSCTTARNTPHPYIPPDITINCHSSSSLYFYCTTAGFHPHNS